jgi:hypothetical protein
MIPMTPRHKPGKLGKPADKREVYLSGVPKRLMYECNLESKTGDAGPESACLPVTHLDFGVLRITHD